MELMVLIPYRLSYGPVGSAAKDQVRLALNDITAPEFRNGRYEVCHYHSSRLGGCLGLLAIDQTLWFGHELHARLKDGGAHVTVEYEPEGRQNLAVLVGAYLVLGLGWSAGEVRGALPQEARLTFPCSWIDPVDLASRHGAPRMTVQDCWEGVQMARDMGWLRSEMIEDGVVASLAASKFWKTSCEYDGAWLVPSAVFVMADPMTTIKDPNPATCAAFCRERDDDRVPEADSLDKLRMLSQDSPLSPQRPPSCPGEALVGEKVDGLPEVCLSAAAGERDCPEFEDGLLSLASVHTVYKAYGSWAARVKGCDRWPDARPYVDFLLEEGIRTVLRLNSPDERGLAEIGGSYDAGLFAEFGIQHADVPVSDSKDTRRGGVPPAGAIRRFLSLTRHVGLQDGAAMVVHCKGGFGRSVFLACLRVIYRYDVPGCGLLGWARMARPGAITTPEQETVLRSLSGRGDLCRRYGIPRGDPDGTSAAQGCCAVT
ncbi:unnamed protein product [Prorocentrum cordatum]|uniref:Tyrosine specific protein phosphatases domain-containing protein n=1 Tax=Prorocentrum cordatum TaxID=2364126 RepID=A0ABN9QI31_9DINO|nr:unnamed protein product [Polarella glacialis]